MASNLPGLGTGASRWTWSRRQSGLTLRQHRLDPWLVFSPMGNEVHHGLVCRQRIGSGRLQLSLAQGHDALALKDAHFLASVHFKCHQFHLGAPSSFTPCHPSGARWLNQRRAAFRV